MAEVFNTQNLGAYGIETGTPIINAPQSTLVFAGAIVRTVVPGENDEIRIAPIMKLSVCSTIVSSTASRPPLSRPA
jgi:pyruvate/2-oxoglutarate dehydrogenase complex dihydrolipoamide acyltransferase (E2) component